MAKIDVLRKEILTFLSSSRQIRRLNFSFKSYRVYPTAYQRDIYNAIKKKDIEVEFDSALLSSNDAAKYQSRYLIFTDDRIKLSPVFSMSKLFDKAVLVHECTHEHIDNQSIGTHSGHDDEAVGYLAEAVFMEASRSLLHAVNNRTLGINNSIRRRAHAIARRILSGLYRVPAADARALVGTVRRHPKYRKLTTMPSNGV